MTPCSPTGGSTKSEWSEANDQVERLWSQYPAGTTQLVLQERGQKRKSALLERGDFLSPRYEVTAGVPAVMHRLADQSEWAPRLAFAHWLVDRDAPTTARSIVNRIWQAYFGSGIVETTDDLGSQGTSPSHPELLDWLAVELMDNGWRLKHLHRLIALSSTYRQSSHVTSELYERDPYNRLLARGPRFRVDAEIVRDITLSASGLLNREVGGPSVYPPAPDFLFQPPASYGPKVWEVDDGADRYRRGMYTFRFRSVPYPMLESFDATPGLTSCVRRSRSNTPLQSLTSLNEPIFMECAAALANLVLQDGGASDRDRITYAMKRCVAREPTAAEAATLTKMLTSQRQRLTTGELVASEIVGGGTDTKSKTAEQQAQHDQDDVELAAWTLLSRVLLNLDETITKE